MIRTLCEPSMEGGYGYTPREVGGLTIDQVFMLLTDKRFLRRGTGPRTVKHSPLQTRGTPDAEGRRKGRDADGKPIKGRIRGRSVARQLMEEQAAAKQAVKTKPKRRRRRSR